MCLGGLGGRENLADLEIIERAEGADLRPDEDVGATDLSFSRVMEWNRICVAPVMASSVRGILVPGRRWVSPVTSTATVMSARSMTTS